MRHQLEQRLLAFADHGVVDRRILEHEAGERRHVLAAAHDRHVREAFAERPEEHLRQRPEVREHDADADQLDVGIDARHDLLDRQTVQKVLVPEGRMTADALPEAVDDLHRVARLARARGEIRHPERRLDLRQPLRVGERRRRMHQRDLHDCLPPGGRLYGRSGGCYLPLPNFGCQR
jgi:hypothetical protein